MNRKVSLWWFLAYTVIVIGAIAYYDHLKEVEFEKAIATKEAERQAIIKERKIYEDSLIILKDSLDYILIKVDSLNTKIETVKKKRNEIPSIVDDMPIVSIDSILSGYVHPR